MGYAFRRFYLLVKEDNRWKENEKNNNVNVINLTTLCIWKLFIRNQETKRICPDRRTKKETVYLGMFKAKILVLGPCESGKTVITNFLSDATETSGGEYHPTQGVRILEFESSGIEISPGKTANCEVELWDCSGNHKFSTCWAAFQKDTNGVLIIYNPDQSSHDKELETWYTQFVQSQGLKDSQCMVFAHRRPSAADTTRSQIPSVLSRVKCIQTNLDEEPETVRDEFHNFLAKVISNWTDKRDQEELSIMNT
ncbi:intraflagellar transport protein 22 homolog isoform X4 [Stylophora pistillata]|uniref:intraflagellar transport protein 22 homolog isoform X4 n=1 Tax=Stylophora pistillata TaxID=50429 RepID=UPI000C04302D|nr:intraflagellar transport protein 22 homolog isoform X4 [Stylophora pistillata]